MGTQVQITVTVLKLPLSSPAFKGVDVRDLEIVELLRKFRILCYLKMVSKFRQIRLILLAISKAFKSYTRSNVEGLVYDINCKCSALLADTRNLPELNQATCGLYIIPWLQT
ncbi:unnamed protein product [Coregonus sp. 'balchen']|nr:unnamed protein product [Coregonus sp. 'balchen']